MRYIAFIFTITLVCSCQHQKLGYAIIDPNLPKYEQDSVSFPFDKLHPSQLCQRPVRILRHGDLLKIQNIYNDGFSGIHFEVTLNPQLKIVDAVYDKWNDIDAGFETQYLIKMIKLKIDQNPFQDSIVNGRYFIKIINRVKANKELRKQGITDTSYYSTFNGKFKIYIDDTIKAKNK
jgi:hypothetical protein